MKSLQRVFVAALVAVLGATGVACKSATPYAAKVNGVVLSRAGLENEIEAMRGNDKYWEALRANNVPVDGPGGNTATTSSQFVARILTRRIYFELVHQEIARRKLKVTEGHLSSARLELVRSIGETVLDAFPKSYYEAILRTTAEVYVLQQALADTSDANLRRYYNDHIEQFESVCAAHILVATKAQADTIVRDLAKARDKKAAFADTAKKKSTDTGSGANGGDLGCAPPTTYVAEFKDAVRTQRIGVVGQPVKTNFGYHVIRVDSREAAKPFEEVKEEVRSALTDSGQGAFTQWLAEVSTKAEIEVNPRYGTFDTSGQAPEVVPPKTPDAAGN